MYPHIIAKLYNEVWLIEPGAHRAMQEALLNQIRFQGHHEALVTPVEANAPFLEAMAALGATSSSRNRYLATYGNTAVISMYGTMGRHLSQMETMCGGCSVDMVQSAMDMVSGNADIKKVVLDVSSPGGQTTGTEETARMFADLATVHGKKTYAVSENQIGSAAYWVGSQAQDGLYVTPSAIVGSVGTYLAFVDSSEEMAKMGRKMEVIKSEGSTFKGMGIAGTTLSPEQRAFLQNHANAINAKFKSTVSKARPGIAAEDMQGQYFRGADAKKHGYADGTISSVMAFLRRLG